MADEKRMRLGEFLEQQAKNEKPPKLKAGPAGPFFADANDMLKEPDTIEVVKQADALALRLGLTGNS